jgi:competence protein ComFC
MWRTILDALDPITNLFYPRICLSCQESYVPRGAVICPGCEIDLPNSGFEKNVDNPFTQKFMNEFPINGASSYFLYTKTSKTQKLIHEFKYQGRKEIGEVMGRQFGERLKNEIGFKEIDLVVPVPLHNKKLHQRGYNQAAIFAESIALTMNKKYLSDALIRSQYTKSLTTMNREERFLTSAKLYSINKRKELEGKHILLVDDVVTTGATLNACAKIILDIPNTKISFATLAFAFH